MTKNTINIYVYHKRESITRLTSNSGLIIGQDGVGIS